MIPDWSVPFILTSAVYSATPLNINVQTADGLYLLRQDGCSLVNQVRSQKEFVPQEDGAILHRRYAGGMEMKLAIQLWEHDEKFACDDLLQEMTDTLMGYLYGLLNAGDNQGRIQWLPDGNSSPASTYRMLDDIRLLSYPAPSQTGSAFEVEVTVDCELPYAEDATQVAASLSGGAGTITNYGNRSLFPVWQIAGPFTKVTLVNTSPTPDVQWVWDSDLAGSGGALNNDDYLEIDTFRNTVTKYANGLTGASCTFSQTGATASNVAAGIDMLNSEFFTIPPGANAITATYTGGGASFNNCSRALINSAFA